MRRFTIRNDMVQRIATLVLCCLLTTTLLSSPTFAEEAKKKEATPAIATPKVEPPKNESNRRMGQVEPPKNESTRRMGHAGPMRHVNKHWQQQQPQHRQFHEQQQFLQPQQTETQTVYIALDSQHESSENRVPRLIQAPRSGPRARPRLRKRIRRPQQQSQAQQYYSPAVVQSMPLPIHGPTGYSQNGAATHMHVISSPTVTTDPKNYAFAYAVRDTDPYNGDDFSHKEARDGKLTMGEYKVVLPDGRTQVVRYTAGNNQGFKADVTYEDEEAPVKNNGRGRTRKPKHGGSYHSTPTTTVHKQYAAPPSPSHSAATPYKNPIYFSRPIKSPQIVFRSNDNEYKTRYQHDNQISISATPSPNYVFKAGPSSRPRLPPPSQATFINGLVTSTRPFHGPKSIYDKMAHMPIQSLKYSKPLGHLNHDKSPRAGPLRSASPGVATPTQATYTSLRPSSPTPLTQYDTHSAYSHPGNELSINRPYKFKLSSQTPTISYNIVDSQNSVSPTPIYVDYNPTGKSKLIPVEYFKAGPATESSPVQQLKVRKVHRRLRPLNNPLNHEHYHTGSLSSVKTSPTPTYHKQQIHPTHSSYDEDDHHSNNYHREINSNEHHHDQRHHTQQQYLPVSTYASPTLSSASAAPQSHQSSYYYNSLHGPDSHEITHTAFPRVKSSLATFTASFPGTKAPLYYKSQPQYPVGRPVRPSTGGLVYLETPGKGLRPTTLGVKESLDQRLPIPHATTSTHPYEVGSADYGKSVAYSNFEGDQQNDPNKKDFTPSEEIPPEFVPHLNQRYNNNHHSQHEDGQHLQHHQVDDIHSFMREYLIDDTKDSIVGAPEQQLDTRLGHLDQASEYAFRF